MIHVFRLCPAAPSRCRAGSADRYPVRRVYCVGRNYAAHAREMGFDPDREPPFFFCKPADAVVPVAEGETLSLPYPPETANLHYEIELVAAIGKGGANIAVENALDHVWGYAVGLDMTRRDLQMKMREAGRPWELGKAFDQSAPIGPLRPPPRCPTSPAPASGCRSTAATSSAATSASSSGRWPRPWPTCRSTSVWKPAT